jgi:L-alanine-DL-glutamate epimerase-like enolase superfamily enzyme
MTLVQGRKTIRFRPWGTIARSSLVDARQAHDRRLRTSDRPGWGTEVNEKAVKKHAPVNSF